jgi:hypothetical protein
VTLLVALLLPAVFWDKGPETAAQLKQAGITEIAVPGSLESRWKGVSGFQTRVTDPEHSVKLTTPGVQYRMNEASASRSPWINSNGWRILREPSGRFYYDAPGPAATLAAAEAFMYGADAVLRPDAAGLELLGQTLSFLGSVKPAELAPVADIGFADDGSPQSGEVMNLLIRRNLQFKIAPQPDPKFKLYVPLGSTKPKQAASDPSAFTQQIRFELGDEHRSLRIYGSEVVIGRLAGSGGRLRVQLLNYAAGARPIRGLRIRVLGRYPKHELSVLGVAGAKLVDFTATDEATEFTVPDLKSYAVVDLSR